MPYGKGTYGNKVGRPPKTSRGQRLRNVDLKILVGVEGGNHDCHGKLNLPLW